MEKQRWQRLMEQLGFPPNDDVYFSLIAAYAEKHRYYHNRSHIDAVLKQLDSCAALAEHVVEIEIALWFHDAIYQPFSAANERDSAEWAVRFLQQNNSAMTVIERVHALIMATLHTSNCGTNDQQLMVDIDLTILGCAPALYQQFEQNIRKEYKWVPLFLYRSKRKAILNSFVARERIYSNDFFFAKLEQQARNNIQDAIAAL